MTLIGTDGGLLSSPVPNLAEVLLAPGERAEVVVSFSADTVLRALPYDRGSMMMGVTGVSRAADTILAVRLLGAPVAPVVLPPVLRAVSALPPAVRSQRFVLGPDGMMAGMGSMTPGAFTINGRSFDPARIDALMTVGEAEAWEVFNATGMDHPFHIHGTQFQVVSRERAGQSAAAAFPAWKDTVNVARGETVRLLMRQDQPGLRMYH